MPPEVWLSIFIVPLKLILGLKHVKIQKFIDPAVTECPMNQSYLIDIVVI